MEDRSETSNSHEHGLLQGWSKSEKFILLESLKTYGSNSTEHIALNLQNKSEKDIVEAIAYFKKKSVIHPKYITRKKKERKKVNAVSRVPLGSWAKVLADSINFKKLQTETAAALHILAEFEDFPPLPHGAPEHNIDFRKIYHTLGNALEGKALPKNKVIATILEKCLLETALTSKSFIRKSTFRGVINSLRLTEADHSLVPRITTEPELAAVRHLALQRAYNPLNISENVLKQSVFTQKMAVKIAK
ncbi:uncharacterized protein LOC106132860 isoform X2 [Amyelois transitella]|nr:uncharacterized protein LOC106132860 isoform X2 [Amyelois transitella]